MSLFDYPSGAGAADPSPLIFENLSETDWNRMVELSTVLEFKTGQAIVHEGGRDDAVYILVEGAVEVVAGQGTIAEITEGSAFGEIAFFDQQPRTAAVRARTDGRALVISRTTIEALEAHDPHLVCRIVLELGRLLAVRNRSLIRLV